MKIEREAHCAGENGYRDRVGLTDLRISPVRLAFIALLALAGVFQAVRTAALTRYLDEHPEIAARFWPGHPRVALALSMARIGQSTAKTGHAGLREVAQGIRAAHNAPLEIEPFLIKGALALDQGRRDEAELLFDEARRRDPRSAGARFFLSQLYLTSGRPEKGLAEAALLARLVSGAGDLLVPGLVQYAHEPGASTHLRRLFKQYPELADQVLSGLAREDGSTDLVIELAGAEDRTRVAGSWTWQSELLKGLVKRGDLARAYGLWKKIQGIGETRPGIFNPGFAKLRALPPFNWTLQSGEFGVAEPFRPSGLQIIYYGRSDAEFASQLMLLPPGRYDLQMTVRRQADMEGAGGLAWSLSCEPGGPQLFQLPLDSPTGATARLAKQFTVPAKCVSQSLKLIATARERGVSEQAVITNLRLITVAR